MAQVTVTINERQFRMACEDGQEDRLLQLAADLDARIAELRKKFGEIGDTRLTVMAALTVADELHDAGERMQRLEEEVQMLQDADMAGNDRAQVTQVAIVTALNSASERIEDITRQLNRSLGGGDIAIG